MFVFAYGVMAYVVFVLTGLYAIGFVDDWIVSQTIDGAARVGWPEAVLANTLVLGLFALQHEGLRRASAAGLWPRSLPAAAERSTRVLVSSVFLMLVFLRWEPIPFELWSLELHPLGLVLELLSFAGWTLALVATFQLDHFALFGLAQALAHARGEEREPPPFEIPYLYRWVRHPIHLGLLVALWCTPAMTVGHLLFAALSTAFVVHLSRAEERELEREHAEYRRYRAHVPMLLPRTRPLRVAERRRA